MKRFESLFARLTALILIISSALLQTACLNPISIDSCGYVVAIGADEGKNSKYEITLELQRESMGEDSQNNGGATFLSVEADDLFGAVNELSSGISYSLNFTRTHVFVFGENLARKGEIYDFFGASFDVLRIRPSALMIISSSPVRDYFGGLAANDAANIAKMQDDMISDVGKTGEIAAINVSKFFEACDERRFDPVMPLGFYNEKIITDTAQKEKASKGENPISDAEQGERIGGMQSLTAGAALFDGRTMTATINAQDTQLMNIGKGDFEGATVHVPTENGQAAIFLDFRRKKVNVDLGSGSPKAKIDLQLGVTVEYDPSGMIGPEWDNGMKDYLQMYLENELMRVFDLLKQAGCDAMGFGRYASKNFKTHTEFESYDWKHEYLKTEADFSVELILDDEYISKHRQ